jgi:acyl-CoA synthetase (AMP-forming)/AMP-acid ligase II
MSLKAGSAPNIALRLARWADERPNSAAILDGPRTISFATLEDECARLGAGLQSLGIAEGTRVVLMVPPGIEMFALAFSLFRIGAVPVFVDPGVGWEHLRTCLNQAEPEAFIGSPRAHLGRLLGGWDQRGGLKTLVVAQGFFPGAVGLGALRRGAGQLRAPEQPPAGAVAALMYTSGSTGAPKGAVYTHEMLSAQIDTLRALYRIEPGEASVVTFPLFGLFDLALGLTAVIPRMDFTRPGSVDPREILGRVQDTKAAQLFGSPALIDRVGRYAEAHGVKLPSLKRVLSAGAPVPSKTLARFAALLEDGVEIHTPYGATESLPVASIGSRELAATAASTAAGRGVCVGRPVAGMEAAIIAVDEAPIARWSESLRLPAGRVGEIAVKGAVVSAAYFNKTEATALAKISDAEGFWHRMGDLGYFDEEGRLWFCGRKAHRVALEERTLYSVCCEGVFNAHPAVKRTALVGVTITGRRIPVLCVELENPLAGARAREGLKQELFALGAPHEASRSVDSILFHPGFPVDRRHNAKIKRELLAVWAAKTLGGTAA